jgi:hypothetical protein
VVEITQKRHRPSEEYNAPVAVKCDLCGAIKAIGPKVGPHAVNVTEDRPERWGKHRDTYSVEEVEIAYRYGSSYPGSSDVQHETLDVCPACWKEKVRPWLESQGATIRTEDHGY